MIWEKIETDPDEVREIARQNDLDLISSSILIRRNLTDSRSLRFLLEDDLLLLHNPFLFRDMEKAVNRVNRAIDRKEKIMVFGDRDVDGITSTVLLVQLIRDLSGRVEWKLPGENEDYGLTRQVIEDSSASACSLIITVDCGISNIDEIALARERGIDTVVIDHHIPQDTLPEAAAIINPKQAGSTYPFRDLAGCAVAAKFAWAVVFSSTPMYGKPVWLLNIKPDNETYSVEAVKLVNLVERERLVLSLLPELSSSQKKRLLPLMSADDIVVYDSAGMRKLIDRIGLGAENLKLTDIRPMVGKFFPDLEGKSLLKIKSLIRPAQYGSRGSGELDMLISLHNTVILKQENALLSKQNYFMDLAALGTLADLMPLADENRIIVKRGLEVLNQMGRHGLRELIIKQRLYGKRITTTDVTWQITPVLNAAGRMGEPEKAASLLLSNDPHEVEELVDYILDLNRKRKYLGDNVWKRCFTRFKESLDKADGKFILVYDHSIPRGITGILASRLINYFKVPAIAIAVSHDKAVGSLRSPYSLEGFLDHYADLFLNYGGHDCAAGFSLASSIIPEFESRFYRMIRELNPPDHSGEKLIIDAEVPPDYLNPNLISVVELFEPYGEGSPVLIFLTRQVRIEALDIIGKSGMSHLKLLIGAGKYRWPAIYWNAAERAGKDFTVHDTVDIAYRLARNYFQNTETLQLTILDLKPSTGCP